jgi:hypothetical protein
VDSRAGTLNRPAFWCVTFPTDIAPSLPFFNPGPAAGDPFPPSADAAPGVIPDFFNKVCPNRTIIDGKEVTGALSDASAATILQAWIDKLERTEDRCVEISEFSGQIFDY